MAEQKKVISIQGAREHNLKNVDLTIPRDKLVVFTGLSGSGKSSLAFDTIYAEGQRRYVESLSAYARQFLEMMQKPDVEHIDGLSPAISIEQKTTSRNPRSTVATVTEIYDYMRLLWARTGVPYSPATGEPISAQTVSQMVDRVMALPEGTRAYLLAPVVRGRKGEYRKELAEWQKAGFTRVRIDGEFYPIEEAPALDKKYKHDIEVVVDRIAVREGIETRLADSFEQALKLADGLAYVDLADGNVPGRESEKGGAMKGAGLPDNRIVFSEKFACPVSGFTIESLEPRLFSFNAPMGACPACDGLGEKLLFDPQLVVPNEALSLKQGAVVPWAKSNPPSPYYMQVLASLAEEFGFSLDTPWQDLPVEVRIVILHGTAGRPVNLTFIDGKKAYTVKKPFEGVIGNLNRRMLQTESAWMREELAKFQTAQPCETCHGKRLKPEALAVKVAGEDISTVTRFSVGAAVGWFQDLHDRLTGLFEPYADQLAVDGGELTGQQAALLQLELPAEGVVDEFDGQTNFEGNGLATADHHHGIQRGRRRRHVVLSRGIRGIRSGAEHLHENGEKKHHRRRRAHDEHPCRVLSPHTRILAIVSTLVSVVVPVFDEEGSLAELLAGLGVSVPEVLR